MEPPEVSLGLTGDELADVLALVSAARNADEFDLLSDATLAELDQPGRDGFVALRQYGENRELIAYGHLRIEGPEATLETVLDPGNPAETKAVSAIVTSAIEELSRVGASTLTWWIPRAIAGLDPATLGFHLERELFRMHRSLSKSEVDRKGVARTRGFVVGKDEPAFLWVNNRAFAAHPDQGGWDQTTIEARERLDWFDPAGLLLHEIDGRVVAFCWTKIHRTDPPLGEIYVLAVDPLAQGRGLGGSMLLAGVAYLAQQGLEEAILYVDNAHRGTVELYKAAGFAIEHTTRAYRAEIPPLS